MRATDFLREKPQATAFLKGGAVESMPPGNDPVVNEEMGTAPTRPAWVTAADFLTGHFPELKDVPEVQTVDGKLKVSVPETAEVPFLQSPEMAIGAGVAGAVKATGTLASRFLKGAEETASWATGGASEATVGAVKGTKGIAQKLGEEIVGDVAPKVETKAAEFLKGEVKQEPVIEAPKPTEPPPPAGVEPTSAKNAVTGAEREARGLDPIESEARRTTPMYDEGKRLVESGERDPRVLAKTIVDKPRDLTPEETGSLVYDRMRLKNEHKSTMDAVEKAMDKGDTIAEAEARAKLGQIEEDLNVSDTALKRAGTEWSATGRMRQLLVAQDYSLAAMVQRHRVKTGKAPAPEFREKLEGFAKQIDDLTAKIAERESTIADLQASKSLDKIKADVAKETRQAKRTRVKQELDVEFDSLVNELKAAMTEQRGSFSLKESTRENSAIIIGKLAKNRIEKGIVKIEELVDSIHTALTKAGIEISKREVRDLISGYGKTTQLSKEEINVKLRELKSQMRLISAYEDAQKGKVPLRSGLQRDLPTNEVRELQRKVKDMMREMGIDSKSTMTPAQRWKTSLDAVKKRLENSIADLEKQIKTGDRPKPRKGIEYDREAKVLQSYRDTLKWISDIGHEKPGMSVEQRIRMALKSAERSVADLERRVLAKDIAPKKGPQTPVTPELKAMRDKRDALLKQLNQLRKDAKPKSDPQFDKLQRDLKAAEKSIGEYRRKLLQQDLSAKPKRHPAPKDTILAQAREYRDSLRKAYQDMRKDARPKKSPEEISLNAAKKRTEKRIAELEDRLRRGDFTKKEKRKVEPDKELLDLQFKKEKVIRQYKEAEMKDILSKRTKLQHIGAAALEIPNAMRSILTSMDLSAVLRQGAFIFFAHPVRGVKAMPSMFKALKSEKGEFGVVQEILGRANAPLYEKAGLYLSEHGKKLSDMEEVYMSRWAEKIPGVGASQRAYTTYLNRLRADSFDAMVSTLAKKGNPSPAELNAIANYINVATGRGNLGMKQNALVGLNTMFFAPRYVASRFQYLAGQPLYRGTMQTRKMIAQEYARFLIGVGVVYELASLSGAKIETDPRSSDFAKIRFGKTRIDPLAGLSQASVLVGRLGSGETKTTAGKVVPIRGDRVPYGGADTASVLGRFLRSKLAPAPGLAVDVLAGRDYVQQKVTPESVAKKMLIPLAFNDIYDTMKEQGVAAGSAMALLSIFGMGLQTYDPKEKRR